MTFKMAARWLAAGMVLAAVGSTQAATMTLTDWRYDRGNTVSVTRSNVTSNVVAGGFEGTLAGAPFGLDTLSLETYCVELTQTFRFGRSYADYEARTASDYFGATGKAGRLAQLFSHVVDEGLFGITDDADELSSVLQLAVWNLVYDDDWKLGGNGNFSSNSQALSGQATALLNHAKHAEITLDLFVLESETAQDQLVWRARPQIVLAEEASAVPEPGSAWLAAAALGLLALRRRRS